MGMDVLVHALVLVGVSLLGMAVREGGGGYCGESKEAR